MFTETIFLSTLFLLYVILPYWFCYCIGISTYFRMNRKLTFKEEVNTVYQMCKNETNELIEELRNLRPVCILFELNDVVHVYIELLFVLILPTDWMESILVWMPLFWVAPFTTIKLGHRYIKHGCIRNHKNTNNLDHKCNYY